MYCNANIHICKCVRNWSKEYLLPKFTSSFLNIWVLSSQQVNVCSCSSKSYNILCNSLEAWEIGIKNLFNFLHVHLCWCICTLWNSLFKIVWYVVKYLSTKIFMSSFEKIPNCETFFYHDSSWLWANLSNWNSVMKK